MMQSICPLAAAGPIKLSLEKEREKEFSSGLHVWVGCGGGQVFSGVLKKKVSGRVEWDAIILIIRRGARDESSLVRMIGWSLFLSNYACKSGKEQ